MYYISPEDIVLKKICSNRGAHNFIMKGELLAIALKNGYTDATLALEKETLAEMVAEAIGYKKLAEIAHVGVTSYEMQVKFGITNSDLKRMAKAGFVSVTGSELFRLYGETREASLYDPWDYFKSQEEIDRWLKEHPKRTKKKKIEEA